MARRLSVTAALAVLGPLFASTALAQSPPEAAGLWAPAPVAELAADQAPAPPAPASPAPSFAKRQPRWFLPVHAVTAGLQAMDAHSTFAALDAGAREINPVAEALVRNRPAFVALKAGVAAGLIWSTGSMAKSHPVRALIVAAAVNSAFAIVVAKNYQTARGGAPPPPR